MSLTLHLVLIFHCIIYLSTCTDFKISLTSSIHGFQMDPHVVIWEKHIIKQDDKRDSLMICTMWCEEGCHVFELKNNICRLYKRYVVMKSADPKQTLQVFYKRQENPPMLGNIHAGPQILVFRHDFSDNQFWPRDFKGRNKHDTSALQYSILDEIDNFKRVDGGFHFKLCYPGLNNVSCYRWSQTENPFNIIGETGQDGFLYKENLLAKPAPFFGLSRNAPYSLLNGDFRVGNWWFAIGSYSTYKDKFVFPDPLQEVSLVELYLELLEE